MSELTLLNISGAVFSVSSTLMSVGTGRSFSNSESWVSSGLQSCRILPVRTHLIVLQAISDGAGPLLVVNTSHEDMGNVLAMMPEPTYFHSHSFRSSTFLDSTCPGSLASPDFCNPHLE